jgi:hypothetical protein
MLRQTALEPLRGIQKNRYRALVRQFYFHRFLETAGFAGQADSANLLDEELVELAGFLGRRGGGEGWALASSYVAVECKLRDRQHAAADILHA